MAYLRSDSPVSVLDICLECGECLINGEEFLCWNCEQIIIFKESKTLNEDRNGSS